MEPQILLSPAAPNLFPKGHSRSPSRSPTRPRITEDILSDLSPATTLDSFTNASGTLRASIEAASPTQRAFGIRAAFASKKIQEWVTELSGWSWPTGTSEGFETPDAKRRKLSDVGKVGRTTSGAAYHNEGSENDEPFWGSLPSREVVRYESRIEQILDDMEDLNVEDIKSQILDTHVLPRSRPSSPLTSRTPPPFLSYTKMDDFTAVVTATVLQALPNLSRLMTLMDIWHVRLLILRQIAPLHVSLNDAEMALKSGWNTLDQVPTPTSGSDVEPVLSRENYEIIRDVLQEKVTILGQKVDHMLDTLEGRQDTIPEVWLDRMEAIEQDYGEWVVAGDRKVREGEWSRDASLRRSKKLTMIPEDDVAPNQLSEQQPDAREIAQRVPIENSAKSSTSITTNDEQTQLPAEEYETTEPLISPISKFSPFDGARDLKQANVGLDIPALDGTPLQHEPVSGTLESFSASDVVTSQLTSGGLLRAVNKTDSLQQQNETQSPKMGTLEITTSWDHRAEPTGWNVSSDIENQQLKPAPGRVPASDTSLMVQSLPTPGGQPASLDQRSPPYSPPKAPRFGHGLANLLRASSIKSEPKLDSLSNNAMPADVTALSREQNMYNGLTPQPVDATIPVSTIKQTAIPVAPITKTAPEKVHEMDSLPTLPQAIPPAIRGTEAEKTVLYDQASHVRGPQSEEHHGESEVQDFALSTPKPTGLLDTQSTTLQRPQISHSRQISASSTISGYSMSDPSPEICEAATEYFSPVVSPARQSIDFSPSGSTPTGDFFSGKLTIPIYPDEERPETPRQARKQLVEDYLTRNSSSPVENHAASREVASPSASLTSPAGFSDVEPSGENIERSEPQLKVLPHAVLLTENPIAASQSQVDAPFVRSQTPEVAFMPQSPVTDERDALSYEDMEESPSLGRLRIYSEGNDYSPSSSPPPMPAMFNRQSLHVQVDADDAESLSPESPRTPADSSFLSNLDLSPSQNMTTPMKVSDDQLQQQISEILETIPARIRLTSEPDTASQSDLRPAKQRSSLGSNFRPLSRAATPSFTLAPAYTKNRRPRPQTGTPEIKLYHLSRSTGEAPIKLFVRLVGEHGERVMVRVGGGWADLGEYLKEYAAHHGRRSDKAGKVEIQDLPPRTVSSGSVSSVSTVRNGNGNGRSSPIPFSRPASSLERPASNLSVRKTRRSLGEADNSYRYRAPSTPLPNRPLLGSRQGTPSETPPARSSSRLSWTEEESSLGLAGPKSRKVEISAENAAWVETMKEKVRLASAEKDRERERERRVSAGGDGGFGELGKVGATKRLFKKSLGGGSSGSSA